MKIETTTTPSRLLLVFQMRSHSIAYSIAGHFRATIIEREFAVTIALTVEIN